MSRHVLLTIKVTRLCLSAAICVFPPTSFGEPPAGQNEPQTTNITAHSILDTKVMKTTILSPQGPVPAFIQNRVTKRNDPSASFEAHVTSIVTEDRKLAAYFSFHPKLRLAIIKNRIFVFETSGSSLFIADCTVAIEGKLRDAKNPAELLAYIVDRDDGQSSEQVRAKRPAIAKEGSIFLGAIFDEKSLDPDWDASIKNPKYKITDFSFREDGVLLITILPPTGRVIQIGFDSAFKLVLATLEGKAVPLPKGSIFREDSVGF